jgi:hypothetical protein
MSKEFPTWEEIKLSHPELAERLKAGDLSARVEFVRLSFNATIISQDK